MKDYFPLMRRINYILHSSRAAIDLASIMVGIIIIGLIGGVIAATVFAVIPWSQDRAAKHQLESIHTAENAFFGLSSDANVSLNNADGTVGSFRNTFTGSTILDSNSLLSLNKDGLFCVIATTDGKDYHAYSKSGSGKWFSATNTKKVPVEYAGSTPCVVGGTSNVDNNGAVQIPGSVDQKVDDGSGDIPTSDSGSTPPTSTYTTVANWDWDKVVPKAAIVGTGYYDRTETNYEKYHGGKASLRMYYQYSGDLTGKNFSAEFFGQGANAWNQEAGKTYRVTFWYYNSNVTGTAVIGTGNPTAKLETKSKWTQYSTEFKATRSVAEAGIRYYGTIQGYGGSTYFDDVTIEELNE